MELPKLLQGLTAEQKPLIGGGGAAGGQQTQQDRAVQLAQTATRINTAAHRAYTGTQQLDHNFRLHPSLKGAVQEAVDYMNRTLNHDGLEMFIKHDEAPEAEALNIFVKDLRQEGKIVKEYAPQDVLRYYAHSGYGSGLVIDGKI